MRSRGISNRCYESPGQKQLGIETKIDTNRLVQLLYDFYQDFRYSFMYTIFKIMKWELLIRKLPKEVITNHHLIDDRMVKKLYPRIDIRENVSVEIVSALFRTIAMTILHIEECRRTLDTSH